MFLFEKPRASIFIEKLADANNLLSLTGTKVLVDSNVLAPIVKTAIQWSTQETIDSNTFTHSTSANSHQITVKKAGDYLLLYNDAFKNGNRRNNPRVSVQVNGGDVEGALSKTHYNRRASGHDESSTSLVFLVRGLVADDVVTVRSAAMNPVTASSTPAT